jgi:hypothetical protein
VDEAELLAGCSDGDPLMALLQSSSHLSVAQIFGVCVCIYTKMCVYVVSSVCVSHLSVARRSGYVCIYTDVCVCMNIVCAHILSLGVSICMVCMYIYRVSYVCV